MLQIVEDRQRIRQLLHAKHLHPGRHFFRHISMRHDGAFKAVLGGFGLIAGPAGSLPRLPSAEERSLAATPPPKVEPLIVKAIAPQAAFPPASRTLDSKLPDAG